MLFIAYVGAERLAISTIEVHLAGLRSYRILTDYTDMTVWFHTPFINLILNRIKRVNAAEKPTWFGCPLQLQL